MFSKKDKHQQCEEWKGNILKNNNVMKFMLFHMKKIGCPLKDEHYVCKPCAQPAFGHFNLEDGVVLCEDHLVNEDQTADTMMHETIHAFDHCRIKMDWNNCKSHACSEIRAANLSGDCSFSNELQRGNFGFLKHHQKCVKRRALLALNMTECKENAEKIIDEVFEQCFKDTAPFDEIY